MKSLLLIFLFFNTLLYSQKLPTEKEIYKFINSKSIDRCDLDKASIEFGFKCIGMEGFFEYRCDFILLKNSNFLHIHYDSANIFSDSINFSTKDMNYMKRQYFLMSNFEWKEGKVVNAKLITEAEIKKFAEEKRTIKVHNDKDTNLSYTYTECANPSLSYFTYSMPIFNLKKNICIINISHYNKDGEGSGITLLYKRIKQKWIIKKIYSNWVS